MKKIAFTFLLALLGLPVLKGQEIPIYNFDSFKPHLYSGTDTVYIINFWATWCVPCVKEIPVFNEVEKHFSGNKIKILLVSLDMAKHIDTRLIPFIERYEVVSEVILLDDPDFNTWINKVDPQWSGGIPATLIFSKVSRSFYEKSFDFDELSEIIKTKLNEL